MAFQFPVQCRKGGQYVTPRARIIVKPALSYNIRQGQPTIYNGPIRHTSQPAHSQATVSDGWTGSRLTSTDTQKHAEFQTVQKGRTGLHTRS